MILHPNNTKLLFLILGLPSNQRYCNFEEHFSPSLFCGDPQTILLDKVWPKIVCSRRSDSGERCEVKGARKNKSEGGGEVRVPLYFSSLSLLRTALRYLNAWNRLAQNNNEYCTWHGHNLSFPKLFFIVLHVSIEQHFQEKQSSHEHQSKDTIKRLCYIFFFVNKHFISGPDINCEQGSYASHADHQQK